MVTDVLNDCLKVVKTRPRMLLMLAEVIGFAILAVAASSHYGLADGARITAAMLVAYLIPRFLLTRARATSIASLILFMLLAALLLYVDFKRLTIWTFFDEFSLQLPNIGGDGRAYYKWALHHYDGSVPAARVVYPGFPMMILGLWKVFGLNVVWPLAMDLMFTLTSVVLTGMTTRRLLSHRVSVRPETLMWAGIAMSVLLIYYLVIGTAILKEASIGLSISMVGYTLASMDADDKERHFVWRDFALFVFACLLLALVRTTYLYFILIGVLVMSLSHPRRDWPISLSMLGIIGLSLLLGNVFSSYSFDRHAEIVGGGWNMQRFYVIGDSQSFYHDVLNYYFMYPVWHKVLMLPLTVSVQFMIPLPWNYYANPTFINVLSRLTYGWYIVGGVSLFYFLYVSWRRDGNMGWWPWWAAVNYAVVAYIVAGSVARYACSFEPLFVPVAVYVLCRLWEGRWRRAFLCWSIAYVVLIVAMLLFCLEIQQDTFSKMLQTRSLKHVLQGIPY